jgi:hypothetical protein
MNRNRARLIDKAERSFDRISGMGPLGGVEVFSGRISDRHMKERIDAFCGASHNVH